MANRRRLEFENEDDRTLFERSILAEVIEGRIRIPSSLLTRNNQIVASAMINQPMKLNVLLQGVQVSSWERGDGMDESYLEFDFTAASVRLSPQP